MDGLSRTFGATSKQGVRVTVDSSGTGCSGGIQADDNSFENGYTYISSVFYGSFVQLFNPPGATSRVTSVCVCFSSLGPDGTLDFGLDFWAADGVGGKPGTLIDFVSINDISTATGFSGKTFFRVDIPAGITVPDLVYIGPFWSPLSNQEFYLCADESVTTPVRTAFTTTNVLLPPATPVGLVFPNFRSLGVRAETQLVTCTPTATALCLGAESRFRVEATFATSQGQSGQAQSVKLTDETGYLWFFSNTNVEAVVKILNGCGLNSRFWVFAGGLTDVNVVLTITDTKTGAVKTYANPLGAKFQPIQDTSAFATCP